MTAGNEGCPYCQLSGLVQGELFDEVHEFLLGVDVEFTVDVVDMTFDGMRRCALLKKEV